MGDAAGNFSKFNDMPFEDIGGTGCIFVDLDNDGDLDLYIIRDGPNSLFLNALDQDAELSFIEGIANGLDDPGAGASTNFTDLDLDGDVDCYLANIGGLNALYLNDGAGFFSPAASTPNPSATDSYGALFADLNNDGYPDLYVANDGNDALFFNDGTGAFGSDAAAGAGVTNAVSSRSCQALDYDNDGWLDVFVSNNGVENVLYHNNGDGAFSDVDVDLALVSGVLGAATGAGMGAAVGDIDNDGDMDIWQVNTDYQPAALYRNNLISPLDDPQNIPGRNWLEVRLTGTESNTSAIGARIELWRDGAVWQTREVNGGSGWRSQNSPVQHFGLDEAEFVEEILVHWPSGVVTQRPFISANQILEFTEERELVAIQLIPGRETIAPGAVLLVEAEGIYANGDTEALDAATLYWELSDSELAYVDAAGRVLGLEEGICYLTAQQEEIVSYPAEIIVAESEATNLSIEPETALIGVGEEGEIGEMQCFTATVTYANGDTEEVTTAVDWYNNAPAVASIGRSGRAVALSEGTATIEAEYLGLRSNEAVLTVTDQVSTLIMSPTDPVKLYRDPGLRENPFRVDRSYGVKNSDGIAVGSVQWETEDPFVACFDANGALRTPGVGDANVRATSGGAASPWHEIQVREHLGFTTPLPAEDTARTHAPYATCVEIHGGYPPYAYQWLKDADGMLTPVDDQAAECLSFDAVEYEDAGEYTVEVSDSLSQSYREADVIQSGPMNLEVLSGLPLAGVLGMAGLALLLAAIALTARRQRS